MLLDEAKRIGLRVTEIAPDEKRKQLELNDLYSEMGQKTTTDQDELRAHSNEILNIHEAPGIPVFYQQDKDWYYRSEERRWITMNDNSSWRKLETVDGQVRRSTLHIN